MAENQDEKQGGLTARGEAVAGGYATLAAADGDDTLTVPDENQSADNGATDTDGETERGTEDETAAPNTDSSPSPGPADIPAPPVIETADDTTAATRENR